MSARTWAAAVPDVTAALLKAAVAEHELATTRLQEAYRAAQAACEHPNVSEAVVGDGWQPARVCEDCGLEEHHGAGGFHVLTGDVVRRLEDPADLWKLRPVVGRTLASWCPGNRFYAGHPVVYERDGAAPVDGRCCALHTLQYARDVLADLDPADSPGSRTGDELAAALARYEASHPAGVVDGPRSRQPRVRAGR
jgi:hypothetical protein